MLNKKVLLSLLFIGVVAAAAGSGTWAQFYDVETSSLNTFTAAELDLNVNIYDSTPQLLAGPDIDGNDVPALTLSDIYPGYEDFITVELTNAGSVSGDIGFLITYTEDGGKNPEPEIVAEGNADNHADLGENIWLTITETTGTLSDVTYEGPINLLHTASPLSDETLGIGDTRTFEIKYLVKTPVPDENILQGDKLTFDMVFELDQQI